MTTTSVDSLAALTWLLAVAAVIVLYVWTALALAAVFRKLGEEPWRAWVPVLAPATVLAWGGFSPWLILLGLVPGVGSLVVLVLQTIAVHRLNPGFGHGAAMTALSVVAFPVWASVLGFGSSRWLGRRPPTVPVPRAGVPVSGAGVPVSGAGVPVSGAAVPVSGSGAPAASSVSPSGSAATSAGPGRSGGPALWAGDVARPPTAPSIRIIPLPPPDEPISVVPGRGAAAEEIRADEDPASVGDAAPLDAEDMPPTPSGEVPSAAIRPRPEPWAPPGPADTGLDPAAEVSAVVGSPSAGAPRTAVEVSLDDVEHTVIARRRLPRWQLVAASAPPVELVADVVIVGRHPEPPADCPDAQLIAVHDPTRTLSKTHARLERNGDQWLVVDLHSTNGVVVGEQGVAAEVPPGVAVPVPERLLLGDVELRLVRIAR
ncbi:DUF5684 domain-containing protein [Microbacterium sp.]|uniref:DUF5684 domain-containing protein n=1 Tax=Microbacterium sp. TaxID=51671 RepID=UPI0039E342DB